MKSLCCYFIFDRCWNRNTLFLHKWTVGCTCKYFDTMSILWHQHTVNVAWHEKNVTYMRTNVIIKIWNIYYYYYYCCCKWKSEKSPTKFRTNNTGVILSPERKGLMNCSWQENEWRNKYFYMISVFSRRIVFIFDLVALDTEPDIRRWL